MLPPDVNLPDDLNLQPGGRKIFVKKDPTWQAARTKTETESEMVMPTDFFVLSSPKGLG